ncbi:MAG: hypothetical protein A4E74_00994 [Syntrophus sp. PtaB.Bin075]|nr:MAG: hypothetical protein A4E74_00994 [Syntrophus sp. PtaB.Bin075]
MTVKHAVDSIEKRRRRTPVLLKGICCIHLFRRCHVGKNVRAPETVYRLFWITYEKYRRFI